MQSHIEVRGHHADQQRNEAPGSKCLAEWNKHAQSAKNLADTADLNQQLWMRQVRRHDADIHRREDEVKGASNDKDESKEEASGHD